MQTTSTTKRWLLFADLHHTDTVSGMPTKAEVQQVLSVLDTNKDGKVSVDELKAFLDSADCKLDKKLVQQFIDTHDKDKDGKLDLNELAVCLSQ
ncbi:EF hand [Paragonimus heterotremus]|uniref:EF hand n=1 Tax=Paragonimus heterotremus TaxID=100268 RepID=A0A8J4TET7_9TREM|nr:EF hand [Paragonimus heterotremus]